jgi:hypothetical protein
MTTSYRKGLWKTGLMVMAVAVTFVVAPTLGNADTFGGAGVADRDNIGSDVGDMDRESFGSRSGTFDRDMQGMDRDQTMGNTGGNLQGDADADSGFQGDRDTMQRGTTTGGDWDRTGTDMNRGTTGFQNNQGMIDQDRGDAASGNMMRDQDQGFGQQQEMGDQDLGVDAQRGNIEQEDMDTTEKEQDKDEGRRGFFDFLRR